MSFILLCRTPLFPSTLNHFDNFVYISLYLYGGNVHFFVAYPTNLGERWGGNTINSPSEPSKPRTFLPQTSDVCAPNLGTFHRRSPMFSVSGRCFMRKFPDFRPFCPEIPNLQPLFFLLRFPLSWAPKPFSAPQNLKLFWQNLHPPLQGVFYVFVFFRSNVFPASTVFPTSTGFP